MKKAILKTLVYADIFDYPLTREEIYRFLIADKRLNLDSFSKALSRLKTEKKQIGMDRDNRFFFLPQRQKLVSLRKKREKISQKKLQLAQKTGRLLKFFPTIKLVGVTGRLAMKNSDQEDDIDFLIITSLNRLWLTRLLVTFFLELLGKRRHPKQTEAKDKICLNLFLDENKLALPTKERDLYTAHEVIQVKPLWDRDQTYLKFLQANDWVAQYLPHGLNRSQPNIKTSKKNQFSFYESLMMVLESLARQLQFWYMSKRRTTEVVTPNRALFHPHSARNWILKEYEKKLASVV